MSSKPSIESTLMQAETAPVGVSLCMIICNEVEHLAACYASVAPLISEWIVVDTGSTDGSLELIKALNPAVKLIQINWSEHFAEARNHYLAAASQPWVLVLDADERLSKESLKGLSLLLSQPLALKQTFSFLCEDQDSHAQVRSQNFVERLFCQASDWRYSGRIHELIQLKSGEQHAREYVPEIRIQHLHADLDADRLGSKHDLYLRLLAQARQETPSPYLDYHYANLLYHTDKSAANLALGILNAALDSLIRADTQRSAPRIEPRSVILEIQEILCVTGRSDQLRQRFQQWKHFPLFVESWCLQAKLDFEAGEVGLAFEAVLQALKMENTLALPNIGGRWQAIAILSRCFSHQQHYLAASSLAMLSLAHFDLSSPEQGMTSISKFIAKSECLSPAGFDDLLRQCQLAIKKSFQKRQFSKLNLDCHLLLIHVFDSSVLEIAVTAAIRVGDPALALILTSVARLLWPKIAYFRLIFEHLRKQVTSDQALFGQYALIEYALLPAQIRPALWLQESVACLNALPAWLPDYAQVRLADIRGEPIGWYLEGSELPENLTGQQRAVFEYLISLPPIRQDIFVFTTRQGYFRLRCHATALLTDESKIQRVHLIEV